MDKPLPDFADPPVVEVALAVQFELLTALRTPQIGLLWNDFRNRFPTIEEHAPLDPMVERFGVVTSPRARIQLEMMQKPPALRCWFLNEAGTELIQVQQDRFAHNGRKVGEEHEYPRFKCIRETFAQELSNFELFLERENVGRLVPNQCEVTYVNHIVAWNGWERHGELGRVLTLLTADCVDEFLPEPEEVGLSAAYIIPDSKGDPLGRLRLSIKPAYRRVDDRPIFLLTLVARGRPDGEGREGALRFLDIGREWIVRGFAAMTTGEMHKIWRRRNDDDTDCTACGS